MGPNDDELAGRRAKARVREMPTTTHPSVADDVPLSRLDPEVVLNLLGVHISAGRPLEAGNGDDVVLDRFLAARDRAADELDRTEAALDRQRSAEDLSRIYRDELTGAFRCEAGRDQLIREVDRAQRTGVSLILVSLDVIGLARINAEHSHAVGDNVLRMLGETLQSSLRSSDVIVRYGGDEFVCALWGCKMSDAAWRLVEVRRILDTECPGAAVNVGLAKLQPDESFYELLARADEELDAHRKGSAPVGTARGGPPSGV
jgi:diguanylate cyclase (GGDEF)-like protein